MRARPLAILCLGVLVSLAATCGGPAAGEISRERAIEIARSLVSFQPDNIDAEPASVQGRPAWRVVFRGRLPGQPPLLFETVVVYVDRHNGEIVSQARS